MSSLTRRRHVWQLVFCGFFAALLVQSGCTQCDLPKKDQDSGKTASENASQAPADQTSDKADKTTEKPAVETPSVDGPVKEMKEEPKETPKTEPPAVQEETENKEPAEAKDNATSEPPVQNPPEPPKTPTTESKPTENTVPVAAVAADATPATEPAKAADLTEVPTPNWLPKPKENPAAEAAKPEEMKAYDEGIAGTELTISMVPISGGNFKMGSPEGEAGRKDDEGPQNEVKIDPFWMGKYEITWQQYEQWGLKLDRKRRAAIKDAATSEWDKTADALANPTSPYSDMSFGMGKEGYPAICMTQFAAKMYCKWLSAKTGHYYRLPTEAEWEYACRAGTETAYSFGDDSEQFKDFGWYGESEDGSDSGNSNEKYHKIGLKKPNPWGLYDMHGNVAEWCLDQYAADAYKNREGQTLDNPLVPSTKSYPHVVRGGSWIDPAGDCRGASRKGSTKDWKMQDPQIPQSIWYFTDANFVGFRVVRPLKTPTAEEAAKYEIDEVEKKQFNRYKEAQAGKQ
jgi:formylglycine-generating enzyme required for sulfatase activity